MGKDFLDDWYKLKDPFGSFDFNGDGHYDASERAAVDFDEIRRRERLEREEQEDREWYERSLADDEDEDFGSDGFDGDDLYGESDDLSGDYDIAPTSGNYSRYDEDEEDDGEEDEKDYNGEPYSNENVTAPTRRQVATKQIHISFTVGDPKRDKYIAQNVSGKTYRNESVKARAEDAFGEIYSVTVKGEKADEYYERAVFIRDNGGKIAADYCDYIWRFQIAKAIEEAYGLPKEYTDCYESEDNIFMLFSQLMEFDCELCLNVFLWAWKEFSPYKKYDEEAVEDLLSAGLNYSLREEEFEYNKKLYGVLSKDRKFAEELLLEADKALQGITALIIIACNEGDENAALTFTEILLDNKIKKANTKADILSTASSFISNKTAYNTFLNVVLPAVRKRGNAFLNKKADGIESNIKERAWEYGVEESDGEENEEETIKAPIEDWRKTVYIPYGITLNPNDFKEREEFESACKEAVKAARDKKIEAERRELAEKLSDKTVYTLYGIFIEEEKRTYMYKSEAPLNIGDKVTVPFGKDNAEYTGFVAYKKETLNIGVPFPIKNIKNVIRKE